MRTTPTVRIAISCSPITIAMRIIRLPHKGVQDNSNSEVRFAYDAGMLSAQMLMERQYLLMRERILSLAADFDRIERAAGGRETMGSRKMTELMACVEVLKGPGRAEGVQKLLSDQSPGPNGAGR